MEGKHPKFLSNSSKNKVYILDRPLLYADNIFCLFVCVLRWGFRGCIHFLHETIVSC